MERDLECGHLVQNAAHCPDVSLLSIGFVFNQLWTGRRREKVHKVAILWRRNDPVLEV